MLMLIKDLVFAKPQHEDPIPLARSGCQQIAVSRLHLRRLNASCSGPVIPEDTHNVGIETIEWLIVTKVTEIAVAFTVALIWRSAFMILWLLPLLLKILSACFSIPREGLVTTSRSSSAKGSDPIVKTKIIPNGNGFQVIEGEESLIVQFFRHFGHPIRSRRREILQITVVTAFGPPVPLRSPVLASLDACRDAISVAKLPAIRDYRTPRLPFWR